MSLAKLTVTAVVLLSVLAGCATLTPKLSEEAIAAILNAPERTAADRANDTRRKAAQMLAFIDVRPGMRVLDLGAGGGYTTELLARSVGERGLVYAQNDEFVLKFVKP